MTSRAIGPLLHSSPSSEHPFHISSSNPFEILESVRAEFRKKRAGGRKLFKGLNYDLDITYITSRIIVMSIPTEDWFIGYFRNDATLVHQFLQEMHGSNHYMIFNCSEFRYDKTVFCGNVIDWNFPDHYNPPLEMMMSGCRCIHEWLLRDENNVALIHCAGGKGRSGTLICAYLLYCSMFHDAIDSLNYFALKRFERPINPFTSCQNGGINSPSQVRYISYIQHLKEVKVEERRRAYHSTTVPNSLLFNETIFGDNEFLRMHGYIPYNRVVSIEQINIYSLSPSIVESIEQDLFELEIGHLSIQKIENPTIENSMRSTLNVNDCEVTKIMDVIIGSENCNLRREENFASFTIPQAIPLSGDIIIIFGIKHSQTYKRKEIGRIGIHTAFLPQNIVKLSKLEIDGVHRKDIVSQDFRAEIIFKKEVFSNHDDNNNHSTLIDQQRSILSHTLTRSELFSFHACITPPSNHFAFIYSHHHALPYHRYANSVMLEKALQENPSLSHQLPPSVLFSNQYIHPRDMRLKVKLSAQHNEQDVAQGKFISVTITIG